MAVSSPGLLFRKALQQEQPLQIVGVINAYCALMAEEVGFKVLYLSGAGVANACYGLPDLGMTSLDNVAEEVRRITKRTKLPLLVDADTGWGHILNVAHSVEVLEKTGAAGMHIEDQIFAKRCGHRDGKKLVDMEEMSERIRTAVQAKQDPDFVVMARTDAYGVEGLQSAIVRAKEYVAAGADMIFAEAMNTLDDYQQFARAIHVPVLANLTEFGKTPLFTLNELKQVGIAMALYPLSAFRAMNQAALEVYQAVKNEGTQKSQLDKMQTREELYKTLDYHYYEQLIDGIVKEDINERN